MTNRRVLPRVLIDGYYIDRPYGFGRYIRELVHAMDHSDADLEPVLLVPDSAVPATKDLRGRVELITRRNVPFPLWEQVIVPWTAWRASCSLIHFPYQSSALVWPAGATVATIHDLMFLGPKSLASTPLADYLAHVYRRTMFSLHTRRARRTIAVSAATQADLLTSVGVQSTVVPNICDAFVTSHQSSAAASSEGRFFLHRGQFPGTNKNTQRVIEAFAAVRRRHPDVRLMVYGTAPNEQMAMGPEGQGVSLLGKISDERLAALYKSAVAIVAPSLVEGFGLSIIEGFGFGTPVITSARPPMGEIADTAALLVDPTSVGQISDAMLAVLEDGALRESLIRRGAERYQLFRPTNIANQIAAVYKGGPAAAPRGPQPQAAAEPTWIQQ